MRLDDQTQHEGRAEHHSLFWVLAYLSYLLTYRVCSTTALLLLYVCVVGIYVVTTAMF